MITRHRRDPSEKANQSCRKEDEEGFEKGRRKRCRCVYRPLKVDNIKKVKNHGGDRDDTVQRLKE